MEDRSTVLRSTFEEDGLDSPTFYFLWEEQGARFTEAELHSLLQPTFEEHGPRSLPFYFLWEEQGARFTEAELHSLLQPTFEKHGSTTLHFRFLWEQGARFTEAELHSLLQPTFEKGGSYSTSFRFLWEETTGLNDRTARLLLKFLFNTQQTVPDPVQSLVRELTPNSLVALVKSIDSCCWRSTQVNSLHGLIKRKSQVVAIEKQCGERVLVSWAILCARSDSFRRRLSSFGGLPFVNQWLEPINDLDLQFALCQTILLRQVIPVVKLDIEFQNVEESVLKFIESNHLPPRTEKEDWLEYYDTMLQAASVYGIPRLLTEAQREIISRLESVDEDPELFEYVQANTPPDADKLLQLCEIKLAGQ